MFWTRELAGWALMALGLVVFGLCYAFLQAGRIFEAGPTVFIGFLLFRGGLHLLKVAVAARICQQVVQPEAQPSLPHFASRNGPGRPRRVPNR